MNILGISPQIYSFICSFGVDIDNGFLLPFRTSAGIQKTIFKNYIFILCISRYARPASVEELFDGYPLAAEELDELRLGNNQRKRSEPEHFSRSKIDIYSDLKFVFDIPN